MSLNGSEGGFHLLHVTLCCVALAIMVKWKILEWRREEAETEETVKSCSTVGVSTALTFINKVEAL